ncbi:conserved hypothetical protein [Ricinus communis]|uniref:Uncharacterized protein n=1 Tax=Ricinus communis TaxID=3988 RepID=B9TBA7_RICCO|nr:conserved hypothetical protein [Ricinus communis]
MHHVCRRRAARSQRAQRTAGPAQAGRFLSQGLKLGRTCHRKLLVYARPCGFALGAGPWHRGSGASAAADYRPPARSGGATGPAPRPSPPPSPPGAGSHHRAHPGADRAATRSPAPGLPTPATRCYPPPACRNSLCCCQCGPLAGVRGASLPFVRCAACSPAPRAVRRAPQAGPGWPPVGP